MAVIQKIRNRSGLAVIIIGVAIAAFVIGDFGKKRAHNVTDIGVVDGEPIAYMDFNGKVEETMELQKENTGTDRITEEQAFSIRQSTFNQMVKTIILEEEYSKLGLTVSPEELFDQVQGKNPHKYILQYFKDPNTGIYDPAMVLNYLKNLDQMEPKNKTQWLQFEKAIKEDRQEMKFNNLVAKGFYQPKALLNLNHIHQTKSLKIRYISPSFAGVADSTVKLTDEDYQKFYDKNVGFFYSDEAYRDIDFVVFDVVPSETDRKNTAEDVAKIYADFTTVADAKTFTSANTDKRFDTGFVKRGVLPGKLDSIMFNSKVGTLVEPFESGNAWIMAKLIDIQERPDSMQASHIMVSWEGTNLSNTVTRTKEQAKLRADSIAASLKNNPIPFADLARQLSDFPSAKDDGGDLKWFMDGGQNYALFFTEGLTMKANDVRVVETGVGYSVFKLTAKTKPVKKVQVAVLQRDIEPSTQTFQDTYLQASTFQGQNKTQAAFDTAVRKTGLSKRNAGTVRETDNYLQGLQNAREVVRWAYAEKTVPGEISPVFDLTGRYVVALLKDKTDKGLQPLDKVKERLEPAVRNVKKIEMTAKRIEDVMKTTTDFSAMASQLNARIDTTIVTFIAMNQYPITRDLEVVGKLFTLPANSIQGPLIGNQGTYLVIIDEIIEASPKEDFTMERSQALQAFGGRASNGLFEALKKSADITDSRLLFY
ncbi:MAG: SurA N-terminal domain-containing protein [Marinilabiliales bacterium]|nr:SurA N-terminal domain-containing protein [Marinilabiliales bacterium]